MTLANEQYSQANLAMTFVSGSDPESADFIAYHDTLIQAGLAGKPWYALPQSTLNNLLSYKDSTTSVAENAKTLNYYYNGVYSPLVPLDTVAPPQAFQIPSGNDIPEQLEKTIVYPNPFNQTVIFELPNDMVKNILVTDLLGRTLWIYNVTEGERIITWTPKSLDQGTYLYLIRSDGRQTQQGKLLFIK